MFKYRIIICCLPYFVNSYCCDFIMYSTGSPMLCSLNSRIRVVSDNLVNIGNPEDGRPKRIPCPGIPAFCRSKFFCNSNPVLLRFLHRIFLQDVRLFLTPFAFRQSREPCCPCNRNALFLPPFVLQYIIHKETFFVTFCRRYNSCICMGINTFL